MTFYEKLKKELSGKVPKNMLELLPRSYQRLGKIILIKMNLGLIKYKKKIGKAIIRLFPYIDSVFLIRGIKTRTRKPDIELIGGKPCSQTLHKEYGSKFLLDVSEVMWSKGNKAERQRLVEKVKKNEIIVDMFAGIGYFSIFLAKDSRAKRVYSIEINPISADFLRKNSWLNEVENKIEVLEGDCRKFADILKDSADRIMMGYLFDTEKYFDSALKIAKKSCFIHFHIKAKEEELEKIEKKLIEIGKKNGYKVKLIETKKVKTYAPNVAHYTLDLRVTKS